VRYVSQGLNLDDTVSSKLFLSRVSLQSHISNKKPLGFGSKSEVGKCGISQFLNYLFEDRML
jgi:hypothetical protein